MDLGLAKVKPWGLFHANQTDFSQVSSAQLWSK